MKYLVYTAALVLALLSVLSTRFLIPAFIVLFKSIERGFAPAEPTVQADGTLIDGPWWYHELKSGTSAAELIAAIEADVEPEPLPVVVEEAPKPVAVKKPAAKTTATKAKPAASRSTRKRSAKSKTTEVAS